MSSQRFKSRSLDTNDQNTQASIQKIGIAFARIAAGAIRVKPTALQRRRGFRTLAETTLIRITMRAGPTTGAWLEFRSGARPQAAYGSEPLLCRCLSMLFWACSAASKPADGAFWGVFSTAFGPWGPSRGWLLGVSAQQQLTGERRQPAWPPQLADRAPGARPCKTNSSGVSGNPSKGTAATATIRGS